MSNNNEQHGNSSLQKIHQDFTEKMMRKWVGEDDIALFIKHIKNKKDARFMAETITDIIAPSKFFFGPFRSYDTGSDDSQNEFRKILIRACPQTEKCIL